MTRLDDYGLRGLCGNPSITLKGKQNDIRYKRFTVAYDDFKALHHTNDLGAFYRWLFEEANPMDPVPTDISQK